MSHNSLCGGAIQPRCRCSCGGLLHGTPRPAGVQLTLIMVGGGAGASEASLAVWLEDNLDVYSAVAELAGDALRESIAALAPSDRRHLDREPHLVCRLLAEMAELTDTQRHDVVVAALRVGAVGSCPNIEGHAAVRRLCAEPLAHAAEEHITTALRRATDRWFVVRRRKSA